jgi:hypothetical protein
MVNHLDAVLEMNNELVELQVGMKIQMVVKFLMPVSLVDIINFHHVTTIPLNQDDYQNLEFLSHYLMQLLQFEGMLKYLQIGNEQVEIEQDLIKLLVKYYQQEWTAMKNNIPLIRQN